MSYPQQGRVPVQDRFWVQGMNSLVFPTDIAPGGYAFGENGSNRGGVYQTRPGKQMLFALPGTRAQGLTIYRPFRQKEQLVWAVDGDVFFSVYPFTTYHKVPLVHFYHNSPRVYFCQARQGVQLNLDGSLTILPQPVDLLMMQDGFTPSAFYIANSARTTQQSGHNLAGAPWSQCPVGTVMCYSGSRLWVAYQETIYASDLLNPNSFTEGTYLAEADGFKLPEPCTGLLQTPSDPTNNIAPALMAFSPFTVTSLQSGVIDRTQWQQTQNFQSIISSDYGNVAPFAPVNNFGMPFFFSEVGFMSLNTALNQYRSSRVDPDDMQMLRSKLNLSPDLSGVATIAFENWLLVAVPSGSRFNKHTWVLDGSSMAQMGGTQSPPWVGIWTGTFPVQFAEGEIQDVPRCFELSYSDQPILDEKGDECHIQIWEDFIGRRTDNCGTDTPIEVTFETKIFEVSQIGELNRFKFVEVDVVELIGDVFLEIWYAGIKGHYRLAYSLILSAEEGLPGNPNFPLWTYQGIATDTFIQTFRPQTRTVKTPDFSGSPAEQNQDTCADTCGIESTNQHDVDRGFQLLFNWQGRMGIREIRMFVEAYPQPGIGNCTPSEAGKTNIVSAIGCLPSPQIQVIPVP